MKIKTLIVTVLALAALSVVAYFVNRPTFPPTSDVRVNQPLLPATIAESAAKVKISAQGKIVELVKQPNGTWQVASYHDMPVDFPKLSTLVGQLTSAKVEQLVTANPQKLERLEFKDGQITLLDTADKTLWSITLGKIADAGGRFIRFGDEPMAFRAKVDAWLDPESKSWADASLVAVTMDRLSRVEISMPEGSPVVVTRAKSEDPFTAENPPAGQKLNTNKITSVLSSLTPLRFTETTEPTDADAAAAKQNLRNVKLTTFDGKSWTIGLGRKPEQKIVKPPVATVDGKTGPAALGPMTGSTSTESAKGAPSEVIKPEIETIPAGPVYAFVTSSGTEDPVNALMSKRSFQVAEYEFTSLPQKAEELFEAAPPPGPATAPAAPPATSSPSTPSSAEQSAPPAPPQTSETK